MTIDNPRQSRFSRFSLQEARHGLLDELRICYRVNGTSAEACGIDDPRLSFTLPRGGAAETLTEALV